MKTLEKFDEKKVYPKCIQAYKSGGFHMNYDKDEKVKEIILQTSKEVAKTLLAGQFFTLTNLVKPIAMCSTISVMESQALQFQTFPYYMNQAAASKDPVMKMRLTITAFTSAFYRSFSYLGSKMPLDPTTGETLQAVQEDGSIFYGETIQRAPTIIAFLLVGPNENYKVYGSGKLEGEFKGLNMLRGYKRGKTLVKFNDGTEIQVTNPILEIDGILTGARVANYIQNVIYADKNNQLLGEVTFQNFAKQKSSGIGGKISGLFGSKKEDEYESTTDNFTIEISKYEKNAQGQISKKVCQSKGSGSWVSYMQFDGDIYWKITDSIKEWVKPENTTILPSDSTLRMDKQYLIQNKSDLAQEFYNNLQYILIQRELIKINKEDNKDDELRKKGKK